MERKLASIQRITALAPITGADKIEVATVLGWQVVVVKGQFKVGDLVIYCEIDSILPEKPEFEFLRDRKFRIRTIKLKGQVSQGICFPLTILPRENRKLVLEGTDVTEALEIRKHDPQADYEKKETDRLAGVHRNRFDKFLKRYAWYRKLMFRPTRLPFPSFIRKTDEDRIQLFPNFFEKWGKLSFDITEKIDGQSATYFCVPNPKKGFLQPEWLFGVCSRNFQLLKPDNSSYWTIAKQFNLKEKMINFCKNGETGIIIQGEIIGKGIQGNKYQIDGYRFFVFNMGTYNGKYEVYDQSDQIHVASCVFGLEHVPWLHSNYKLPETMEEIVNKAKGFSGLYPTQREGIVVRNYENNISFKVINPDFLLKYQE